MTNEARNRSTIIYFLVSLLLALVGLILTVIGSRTQGGHQANTTLISVGTSLLAAGIASAGFGILRHFDDKDERAQQQRHAEEMEGLDSTVDRIRADLKTLIGTYMNPIRLVTSANQRCVSDTEIGSQFRREFARSMIDTPVLRIDLLGLKLFRFLQDQLEWMIERQHEVNLRLLLQDPDSSVFDEICELEARNLGHTRTEVERTIEAFEGAAVEGRSLVWKSGRVRVELRFFGKYQPVTLFRVQDVVYVRPRVSTPRGAASRFYEIYESRDGGSHYDVHLAHFQECWDQSHYAIATPA
ncbi:MAG: hypothetical protein ACJ71T_15600 [Actinomycetales bacterium]